MPLQVIFLSDMQNVKQCVYRVLFVWKGKLIGIGVFVKTCRWIHKGLVPVIPSRVGIWVAGKQGREEELLFITHTFEFHGYIYSSKINIRMLVRGKNESYQPAVVAQVFNLKVFCSWSY